jgi:catechol 2,3-dioxygenase-like lactoylglutathione lyase family enzyme
MTSPSDDSPGGRGLTVANDHVAIRVTDIDRSTRFYVETFAARPLTRPFVLEGEFAELMMGGPAGVRFRMRQLAFGRGILELFEFLEPAFPADPAHASVANILHLGFEVDDVDAALRWVIAGGGRVIVPVTAWDEAKICFCADPDGNVIELADAPLADLVRHTINAHPDAAL